MNIDDNAPEIILMKHPQQLLSVLNQEDLIKTVRPVLLTTQNTIVYIEERMERRINYVYDVMECIISII